MWKEVETLPCCFAHLKGVEEVGLAASRQLKMFVGRVLDSRERYLVLRDRALASRHDEIRATPYQSIEAEHNPSPTYSTTIPAFMS